MSNTLQGTQGPLYVRDAPAPGSFVRGTLIFAATVNVADPAGLTDTNMSTLSLDSAGRLRCLMTPVTGTVFSVAPAQLVDSLGATGRAVAPAIGAAIVTVAAPPAGTYEVQVLTSFDGAVAAAEINNMELREGASVRSVLLCPSVANVVTPVRTFLIVLDGVTAVSVNATGAGTAAVGYNAELVLVRVA
jgi:hypothetical protein